MCYKSSMGSQDEIHGEWKEKREREGERKIVERESRANGEKILASIK